MLNNKQFRELIVKPCLHDLNYWSEAAEELMVLTCATESLGGTYIKQVEGPALGIYQMEPVTYHDIWASYISKKSHFAYIILQNVGVAYMPPPEFMIYNLKLATYMARLCYLRVPEKLPEANDIKGLAEYWKKYYNTEHGAGTVDKAVKHYNRFIGKR